MDKIIPQKIHYCWFGGTELPETAKKCIDSWKKFFPDYQIIEWNENNYDVNKNLYIKQAYHAKKFAFVSDYVRFDVLYNEGGLYFDTDVEVIKDFEPILKTGAFMGCERDGKNIAVAPGLGLGVQKKHVIYKEILDYYNGIRFLNEDGTENLCTVVEYVTNILMKHGLKSEKEIQNIDGIFIYPKEYFSPKDVVSKKIVITKNTYSIHHYDGTWLSGRKKEWMLLCSKLENGNRITQYLVHSSLWNKIIGTIYKEGIRSFLKLLLIKSGIYKSTNK